MQTLSDKAQSVELLFDRHFHHLVFSSFSYVKDYHQAEDIVQDVFVKLWQNFDEFGQVEDQKSYLFRAVKNSSLNYLRHVKVIQKFARNSGEISEAMVSSPEEQKTDDEDRHRIHTAVSKLPDHWREALVLSKYDNLKYHEIAGEMRISQKTVEKYISKALQLLRLELRDLLTGVWFLVSLFAKNIFPKL